MAQHIDVVIDEKGDVTVTTRGFAGKSCQDATKQLEAALGATTGDQPTAEMHRPVTQALKAGAK